VAKELKRRTCSALYRVRQPPEQRKSRQSQGHGMVGIELPIRKDPHTRTWQAYGKRARGHASALLAKLGALAVAGQSNKPANRSLRPGDEATGVISTSADPQLARIPDRATRAARGWGLAQRDSSEEQCARAHRRRLSAAREASRTRTIANSTPPSLSQVR